MYLRQNHLENEENEVRIIAHTLMAENGALINDIHKYLKIPREWTLYDASRKSFRNNNTFTEKAIAKSKTKRSFTLKWQNDKIHNLSFAHLIASAKSLLPLKFCISITYIKVGTKPNPIFVSGCH